MNEPTLPETKTDPKESISQPTQPANNAPIRDMAPKINTSAGQMDMTQYLVLYRQAKAIFERNVVETAFDVVRKEIDVGTQMTDKDSKEPLFMSDGITPRLFADRFYIFVMANNKELKIKSNRELYDSVTIGERYLFKGFSDWVNVFGKTEWMTVYTSAVPLVPIS